MTGPASDLRTAVVVEAAQLVLREREARDLCWWHRARACFHPDATVGVGWFAGPATAFVTGSARMAAAGGTTAHRCAPPVVHLGPSGERAVVVLPATITSRSVIDGVETDLSAEVRIVYRVERREGQLRIARMDCVYGRDTLTPTLPGQTPNLHRQELAALRPSYRMLAWSFRRRGIPVRDDLLGDDRPEPVAALFAAAFAWAGLHDPATSGRATPADGPRGGPVENGVAAVSGRPRPR